MSIVTTVGKGIAWNTIAVVIGKVVIFANLFLILRTLTVYDYGLAQLVLSVVSIVSIVMLPGLYTTIVADLGVERARKAFGNMKSLFLQFSGLSIVLSVITWAVLFFGADTAAALAGNVSIAYLLKIASFTLLITPLRTISTSLATVELRYFDQSFYGIVEESMKFIGLVACFFWLHLGLAGLLFAIVFSQIATVVLYAPRTFSAYRVFSHAETSDSHALWRVIHRHRKWSIASSYVGTLGSSLQLWIIRFFLGTEAVGLFSFADGIVSQVSSFLPFGTVLTPLLPRYVDKRDDFVRYVKSAIKAQMLLSLPLVVATFIGLPILVAIFPKYAPAVPLIVIMIFSIVPVAAIGVYTPAFLALKAQLPMFFSITAKVIFIAAFTAFCVYLFGVPGIAIGALLATAASALERAYRLHRLLPTFSLSLRDFYTLDAHEREFLATMLLRSRLAPFVSPFIPVWYKDATNSHKSNL